MVLAKGSVNDIPNAIVVDIFGKIGEDPGDGWTSEFLTGGGSLVTKDHSMLRKASIKNGETNHVISFFDPFWNMIPFLLLLFVWMKMEIHFLVQMEIRF